MIEEQFEGELNLLRSMAQQLFYLDKHGVEIDRWKESEVYDELLSRSVEWHDEFFTDKSKDDQIKQLKSELSDLKIALKELAPDEGDISTGQDVLEEPTDNSGDGPRGDDGSIGTIIERDAATGDALGE